MADISRGDPDRPDAEMRSQYSRIDRSEENLPERAVFKSTPGSIPPLVPSGIESRLSGEVVSVVREHQNGSEIRRLSISGRNRFGIAARESSAALQPSAARNSALASIDFRCDAIAPGLLDLIRRQAKKEEVLVARFLADFDVGAVQRVDCHGAVDHEFHVAG